MISYINLVIEKKLIELELIFSILLLLLIIRRIFSILRYRRKL